MFYKFNEAHSCCYCSLFFSFSSDKSIVICLFLKWWSGWNLPFLRFTEHIHSNDSMEFPRDFYCLFWKKINSTISLICIFEKKKKCECRSRNEWNSNSCGLYTVVISFKITLKILHDFVDFLLDSVIWILILPCLCNDIDRYRNVHFAARKKIFGKLCIFVMQAFNIWSNRLIRVFCSILNKYYHMRIWIYKFR